MMSAVRDGRARSTPSSTSDVSQGHYTAPASRVCVPGERSESGGALGTLYQAGRFAVCVIRWVAGGLAVLDPRHPPPKSHTAGRASSGTRLRTLANPSGTRREKCSDGEFVGLGGKTTALHESQSDVIYFGCSPHPDPLPGVPGRGRHAADRWRIRRLGRGYDLGARGARSQPPAAQIAHCWTSQQWHTITHTSQPQWHTIRHHPETTTPGGSCDTSGAVVILTVCVSP